LNLTDFVLFRKQKNRKIRGTCLEQVAIAYRPMLMPQQVLGLPPLQLTRDNDSSFGRQ
jgi:hypothetical protein